MMTTTDLPNEIKLLQQIGNSTEGRVLILNGIGGHIDLDEVKNTSVEIENLTLPAIFCDDLLLKEIAQIPDKMAFKIGDVAEILKIKQYVLRYWETEFDLLKPKKASNNQRMYTKKDVENALLIRKLLYRDRFSIEGARNALRGLKQQVRKEKDYSQVISRIETIQGLMSDLVHDIHRAKKIFS